MISKPPQLDSKEPKEWIQSFLGYFETVRFEFRRLKTNWYVVQGSDQEGRHPGSNVTAGNSAFIGLVFPKETQIVKEVVLRFIPTVTGTIDYTVTLSNAASGEDEADDTATLTADTVAVTDDQISEIDITTLFADVIKDDQVGVEFVLDAVASTTDVYILGIYFKYI